MLKLRRDTIFFGPKNTKALTPGRNFNPFFRKIVRNVVSHSEMARISHEVPGSFLVAAVGFFRAASQWLGFVSKRLRYNSKEKSRGFRRVFRRVFRSLTKRPPELLKKKL